MDKNGWIKTDELKEYIESTVEEYDVCCEGGWWAEDTGDTLYVRCNKCNRFLFDIGRIKIISK